MNRRTFLATTVAAAAAATMKAASAATVTPFGQTGAPTRSTGPLPLGPLPGTRYPDSHLESAKPKLSFGPNDFPAFAGTMAGCAANGVLDGMARHSALRLSGRFTGSARIGQHILPPFVSRLIQS
jgi:hypothetical protein